MQPLVRSDLMALETYAGERDRFRAQVLEHKKRRQVPVGPSATLYFEDRLTIQYQVQEMLRIERIFEAWGIEDELAAYNPLIPDGTNLKATFMLEYPDADVRKRELARLVGVEDRVWVRVGEMERVHAIADEDLERSSEQKTSSVHFLRFELDTAMVRALKSGASLSMGIDHPAYDYSVSPLPAPIRDALAADLE